MKQFQRIGLIGKYKQTAQAAQSAVMQALFAFLAKQGQVVLETQTALGLGIAASAAQAVCELDAMSGQIDCAVVVGGDGTMLWAARALAGQGVPLIGINQGTLGFMTDIGLQGWEAALSDMFAGQYRAEARTMLAGTLHRKNGQIEQGIALNDAVVSRSTTSMVDLAVRIDGVFAYRVRADAVVVATPTGSTAYALSANGPILHPQLAGWVIAPVAPQTLSNRPITVSDSAVIEIEIAGRACQASFDMQTFLDLSVGDVLRLEKAPYATQLLHPLNYDYFNTLRQKLHWTHNPIL